jgi:hypothetical protein
LQNISNSRKKSGKMVNNLLKNNKK